MMAGWSPWTNLKRIIPVEHTLGIKSPQDPLRSVGKVCPVLEVCTDLGIPVGTWVMFEKLLNKEKEWKQIPAEKQIQEKFKRRKHEQQQKRSILKLKKSCI